jgi:hypothetical protein
MSFHDSIVGAQACCALPGGRTLRRSEIAPLDAGGINQ